VQAVRVVQHGDDRRELHWPGRELGADILQSSDAQRRPHARRALALHRVERLRAWLCSAASSRATRSSAAPESYPTRGKTLKPKLARSTAPALQRGGRMRAWPCSAAFSCAARSSAARLSASAALACACSAAAVVAAAAACAACASSACAAAPPHSHAAHGLLQPHQWCERSADYSVAGRF